MAKFGGLGRLDRAYEALSCSTSDVIERVTTLVWLRQLMDPAMPEVAGHDPRGLGPIIEWKGEIAPEGMVAKTLDSLVDALNAAMGDELLSTGWEERVSERDARAAVNAVASWAPPDDGSGELIGEVMQVYRPGAAVANGAFYTPWSLSLMMAMMLGVEPGKTVCDPCCGSGRLLLAAVQACRQAHPGKGDPILYGVDIDPLAVRATKLNLVLAGVYTQAAAATVPSIAPAETKQGQLILEIAERGALKEAA